MKLSANKCLKTHARHNEAQEKALIQKDYCVLKEELWTDTWGEQHRMGVQEVQVLLLHITGSQVVLAVQPSSWDNPFLLFSPLSYGSR